MFKDPWEVIQVYPSNQSHQFWPKVKIFCRFSLTVLCLTLVQVSIDLNPKKGTIDWSHNLRFKKVYEGSQSTPPGDHESNLSIMKLGLDQYLIQE